MDGIDEGKAVTARLDHGAAGGHYGMYIGGELGNDGYGGGFHDPLHYDAGNFGVLPYGCAHATFGHAMGAAKVEFEAVCAGVFYFFDEVVPAFFIVVGHERNDHGPVGEKADAFRNFFKVDIEWPIANEFDVVETHNVFATVPYSRIAGGNVFDLCAQGFPNYAAPAGFKGTKDIVLLIGRWCTCQPKGIGGGNAEEGGGDVCHIYNFFTQRRKGGKGAKFIGCLLFCKCIFFNQGYINYFFHAKAQRRQRR